MLNPSSFNQSKWKGKGNTSKPNQEDISDKLGKDGKLTPQEHQRHIDQNLCLLCSRSGHKVLDCPKSTKAEATTMISKATETKAGTSAKASEARN